MDDLIFLFINFLIIYLIYLFLIILNKKGLKKYRNSTEIKILEKKYNLNIKLKDMKFISNIMGLSNAFIVSITIYIVGFIDNIIIKLLVGFVVLFPTILFVYMIIGKILKKKLGKKE